MNFGGPPSHFLVRSLSRLQDLQSLAFPPLRHSRGMTVTTACRHACHLAVVWPINTLSVSEYVYFLVGDTFLIWYLCYFYLSAVTALCGAVGLQVSPLGLGISRKKPFSHPNMKRFCCISLFGLIIQISFNSVIPLVWFWRQNFLRRT